MTPSHLVAHAPNGWGHIKPLLALFARMAELRRERTFTITLLSSARMLPTIERELRLLNFSASERLSIIDVGVAAAPMQPIMGVLTTLEAFRDGRPAVCQTTRKEYALPPATVVLLDLMSTPPFPDVRAAAGGAPVLAWVPTPMSGCLYYVGPEDMGGFGDLNARVAAAAAVPAAQGKTEAEVADALLAPRGVVIKRPGAPDVYDYEFSPQESLFHVPATVLLGGARRAIMDADGVVVVGSSAFERESIQAGRQWFGEMGKDVWVVGPLEDVPPTATAPVLDSEHAEEDVKIMRFLDRMKEHHGARSVIYISFGTFFCPKDPAKLHAVLDELLNTGRPFLWSHASPFAKVPDDLAARIDSSAHGFHASWVPQRAVLKHAATGWFVSHGGWNSLQEALSLRVPTILYPHGGDQPSNAAMLSLTHGAAFELLSIREAVGARQPLRTEGRALIDFSVEGVRAETRALLSKLDGVEGQRVRGNAEGLGEALERGWKEGGEARGELERLMTRFFS